MQLITDDLFVDIVASFATSQNPLVEAITIIKYCANHHIDIQGAGTAKYAAFWDADLGEAKGEHRLQKFKRSPTRQAPNAWCLTSMLASGCTWASANGWLLVPWSSSEKKWKWKFAGPSPWS